MKKILFVLPTFPSYRIEFFNLLKKKLLKKKFKMNVYAGQNQTSKKINFSKKKPKYVKIFKTKSYNIFGYTLNFQENLIKSINFYNPETVIILFNIGNINFVLLFIYYKFLGKEVILWTSGYQRLDLSKNKLKFKNYLTNFLLFKSEKLITYGSFYKNLLIKKGYNKNKIISSNNTINTERNIKNYKTKAFDSNKEFLYVGAINKLKNLDILIKSLKFLKNKHRFHLTIVGGGDYVNNLINLSKIENVNNLVSFLGIKVGKDLNEIFKKSDIFILPGIGGLAVNEAMSHGLPIISTKGDGTIIDLVDVKNGILIDHNIEPKALSKIIDKFISMPNEELVKMSLESINKIKKKGTLKNMVRRFEKIILRR
tara:strand:- start:19850 stop:20956 length:1107 start_codon:yes stop_codon:yes gene_type:complete